MQSFQFNVQVRNNNIDDDDMMRESESVQQLLSTCARSGDDVNTSIQSTCNTLQSEINSNNNNNVINTNVDNNALINVINLIRQRVNIRSDDITNLYHRICRLIDCLVGNSDEIDDVDINVGDIDDDTLHVLTLRSLLITTHRDACIINDIINTMIQILTTTMIMSRNSNQFVIQWRACARNLCSLRCQWNVYLAQRIISTSNDDTNRATLLVALRLTLIRFVGLLN